MLAHVETTVKETVFSDEEFKKLLLYTEDKHYAIIEPVRLKRKRKARELLITLVTKHRRDLFNCYGSIRFHQNGYGQFKYVKVGYYLDGEEGLGFKRFSAEYVVDKIIELEGSNNERS